MSVPVRENHTYLGDAVYASFDGYYVWLHLNRHDAAPVVGLEPEVVNALLRYAELHGMSFTPSATKGDK